MNSGGDYTVAFDATPLAGPPDAVTSHTMRGIGRYVGGLLDALQMEQAAWASTHLRPVVTDRATARGEVEPLVTRRLGFRPQDTAWLTAWAFDRLAVGGRRPTLWHGLDPTTPLSPLPAQRTVMTAYDLIPLHEPDVMRQIRFHRRQIYLFFLRKLQRARLVLAISETTADDLTTTLGIPRERIRVIYPAIRSRTEGDSASQGGQAIGVARDDRAPDLLFVGVPDPSKQPEAAIAALGELRRRGRDVRLRFVGYQRPSDRRRLDTRASAAGVRDFVDYLGRIQDTQLTALYRSSVLLAVSRFEGFGLPPVESILAGGRVVCGSATAYRETVGAAAVFATAFDGPGLADAYEFAVARPRAVPPPSLVERFSPAAVARQLVAAYEDAL